MQKKNKANLALGISAAGFIGTMTAGGTGFLPGIIHHGFLAATIGGLADWFAVTAIFHKPLGISYRTDILRRNRQRIMEALVHYAGEDLLSTENIMRVVQKQNMGRLLTGYLEQRGGRERVHLLAEEAVRTVAAGMDSRALAEGLMNIIREQVRTLPAAELVSSLLSFLAEPHQSARILQIMLTAGRGMIADPAVQQVLLRHIQSLREAYEKDSAGRAFVMASLDLSDEKILSILTKHLDDKMAGLQQESEAAAGLQAAIAALLRALAADVRLERLIQDWLAGQAEELNLTERIEHWLDMYAKGENPAWLPPLHEAVDEGMDAFIRSAVWQQRFDEWAKDVTERLLARFHSVIPGFIMERLDELSEDELVKFVETKVQDDLQMIRINGAIVGALVGMGLYLLTALAERMWGL